MTSQKKQWLYNNPEFEKQKVKLYKWTRNGELSLIEYTLLDNIIDCMIRSGLEQTKKQYGDK